MKLAVLGPGALGCLIAALFREAGVEVSLVDYRPDRVARLRLRGIQVHSLEGVHQVVEVPIGLAPEVGPCDLTIVAVKAYQTESAARALPELMSQGGVALTLQNGLGNLEAIARTVGSERLLAGVGLLGVTGQDEGRIIYAGRGVIYIGAPAGSRCPHRGRPWWTSSGRRPECQPREDIEGGLVGKAGHQRGHQSLTALLRVPNGALLQLPEAWEVAVAAAKEAQAVAQAAGLSLSGDPAARLRQVCTNTAANRSSMLQDILAGRPTEIEAMNAQVATRGRALGLPTPVNDLLTLLLRAATQSAPFMVE
jgi:2-dehydropantoate 2-reductase